MHSIKCPSLLLSLWLFYEGSSKAAQCKTKEDFQERTDLETRPLHGIQFLQHHPGNDEVRTAIVWNSHHHLQYFHLGLRSFSANVYIYIHQSSPVLNSSVTSTENLCSYQTSPVPNSLVQTKGNQYWIRTALSKVKVPTNIDQNSKALFIYISRVHLCYTTVSVKVQLHSWLSAD